MTTQAKVLQAVSTGLHAAVDAAERIVYQASELAYRMEERAARLVYLAKKKALADLEWFKEMLEGRMADLQFDIIDAQAELDKAEEAYHDASGVYLDA